MNAEKSEIMCLGKSVLSNMLLNVYKLNSKYLVFLLIKKYKGM